MNTYDVIVLGAGVMGSAAAYALAREGQRVLLLEQFSIDHVNGSSFGNSRIIRYMYTDPAYVALAKAAYPVWRALEKASGESLMQIVGGLDFGRADCATFVDTLAAVAQHAIPVEHLTPDEAMRRFPALSLPADFQVVYQADYGILNASACVKAQVRLAREHGAEIHENMRVTSVIVEDNGRVRVEANGEQFHAARVVMTVGAWSNDLLAGLGLHLPLTVKRIQYAFFRPHYRALYQPPQFPVLLTHLGEEFDSMPYGIPDYDGHGVKFAFHDGAAVAHADETRRQPDDNVPETLAPFFARYVPGVIDAEHVETHVCLYTMTPDEHFVIDRHPKYPQIVFATPCSGHGFKFGALIGEILADMTLERPVSYDLELFSASRFAQESG